MITAFRYIVAALTAYMLGNISTGIIVSNALAHRDIRKMGSGGTGATNILRNFGWLPSILTLIGDVLKAVIATFLGSILVGETGMLVAGVSVIIGHNWPVLYGFKGGKGIATSLGMILVSSPITGVILFAIEVIVVGFTGYMSIASIVSAITYPIITLILFPHSAPRIIAAIIVCVLAVYSHRTNIQRLKNHTENKLDFKKIRDIKLKDILSKGASKK